VMPGASITAADLTEPRGNAVGLGPEHCVRGAGDDAERDLPSTGQWRYGRAGSPSGATSGIRQRQLAVPPVDSAVRAELSSAHRGSDG